MHEVPEKPQHKELYTDEHVAIDAPAGDSFAFDETELHRMVNVTEEPAVTIHVYSPPLAKMGSYELNESGYVRRRVLEGETLED